jgi:DNA replication protein DnaC
MSASSDAPTTDATEAVEAAAAGPEDAPALQPGVCPVCRGARFVRVTADPDDPRFGQPEPCQCVREEQTQSRRQRLLAYSRLGALRRMTFDTIVRRGRSHDISAQERYEQAVAVAERFARVPEIGSAEGESLEGWLVITGDHGAGKTHLAAAIVNRAIDRGEPALFLAVADLLDHLRASYSDDAEVSYDALIEQVRTAPLLVLDDLDAYVETAWAREKFMQIVTYRFHALLPTVFTVSRPLAEVDDRLASRLTDPSVSQVISLGGETLPRYFSVGAMTRQRLEQFTFEDFQPQGQGLRGEARRNLEGAFRLAREWALQPDGWLLLLGNNGCGKTHLAAAIARDRIEADDTVAVVNVPDLLDQLRASFAPDASQSYDRLFSRLLEVDLLVLDDLGAQQSSAWAEEKLYQLLNHRHLARAHTVVTANMKVSDFEPRIRSRLADLQVSTVYEIVAPDYRTGGIPQ